MLRVLADEIQQFEGTARRGADQNLRYEGSFTVRRRPTGNNFAMNAAVRADLFCELTCPACGHVAVETMPTNACVYFYDCKGCSTVLRPKAGDCCVFCSYGSTCCPPRPV